MPNDLANLMGDYAYSPLVTLTTNIEVRVNRVGEQVHLVIGTADPIKLRYKDALRLGQHLLNEGHVARRRREQVEITFGHHTLCVSGREAMQIGQRLQARAAEAKFLVSDTVRFDVR